MGQTAANTVPQPNLAVRVAVTEQEIESALRLRHQVFAMEEQNTSLMTASGMETDKYDAYCDHLIVEDIEKGDIIGTYRLLPGHRAQQNEGFYSESLFNLAEFKEFMPITLELGRSCIAPQYRGGKAIQLLWEGIAQYITDFNYQYLIGCASMHLESIEDVNEIYTMLVRKQVITNRFGIHPQDEYKVQGLTLLELPLDEKQVFRKLPPLMKGYQWLGAEIGGEPAYDPVFKTYDFFIVLDKNKVTRRYSRHFLNSN